tara:strand:- start:10 stop:960 length:951 start_codon:yes stop_codon:yes gene_type:complete
MRWSTKINKKGIPISALSKKMMEKEKWGGCLIYIGFLVAGFGSCTTILRNVDLSDDTKIFESIPDSFTEMIISYLIIVPFVSIIVFGTLKWLRYGYSLRGRFEASVWKAGIALSYTDFFNILRWSLVIGTACYIATTIGEYFAFRVLTDNWHFLWPFVTGTVAVFYVYIQLKNKFGTGKNRKNLKIKSAWYTKLAVGYINLADYLSNITGSGNIVFSTVIYGIICSPLYYLSLYVLPDWLNPDEPWIDIPLIFILIFSTKAFFSFCWRHLRPWMLRNIPDLIPYLLNSDILDSELENDELEEIRSAVKEILYNQKK